MTMTEPMAIERFEEISRHYDGLTTDAYAPNHPATHAAELIDEVTRLRDELDSAESSSNRASGQI